LKRTGPVTTIWPVSRLHYFEAYYEPRYEDFLIECHAYRFSFFRNGYTNTELDPDGNAVWYFDAMEKKLKLGRKHLIP